MKESTQEWFDKAEGDYASALREFRARKRPNYDSACFHAQQCIEKYLKAILDLKEIPFTKIHDLAILLESCLPDYPFWATMRDDMELLSQYAVLFRYPGHSADRSKAREAVQAMQRLRQEIVKDLHLKRRKQ